VVPPRLAWLVDGPLTECELAGALAAQPGASRPVRRFGAGDCRCQGHLVLLGARPSTAALAVPLAAAGGGEARPVVPTLQDRWSRSRSH
jgi:Uri superfamily endonuclease